MKKISKLGFLLLGLVFFVACEKEKDKIMLHPDTKIETTLSIDKIVLEKRKSEENALTVSWEMKNVQVPLAISYLVNFKNGDKKVVRSIEKSPLKLTVGELNKMLLELGAAPEESTDIQVEVVAFLSEFSKISAQANTLNVTSYNDIPDLSTAWGIVGTLNNWGNTEGVHDIPFWKVMGDENFRVAYVEALKDGEIKFRKDEDWAKNYGDKEGDSILEEGNDNNIKINKGAYRVLWNVKDNTYTIEDYAWGIVGDAAKGWNNDIFLTYNGKKNVWEAKGVVFTDGFIKFRFNKDWGLNYGGNKTEGSLTKDNGENISVTAGTYNVTFDLLNKKYKLEKLN